ncbi:asparaginyl-tRNA synthetase [Schizopora paradoxa]|uniref:asparagine--tRNA ligase n=1 Tax=Schizopora paradoxa TaxID=27342 RepID=A0A0H2SA28_9AGAM|nr:asparaginyl-tRNA synthetase [Schizopora paradoxa]
MFSGALRRQFPPTIRQLLSSPGASARIEVNGWIKSVRRQKNVAFAVINDGSCSQGLQAVFKPERLPYDATNGASIRLVGHLVDSPGRGQAKEFQVDEAEVVGACDPETYPIQKQALSTEYLRDQCHLRSRVDKMGTVLRTRHTLLHAFHQYFNSQGFTYAHTPIITSNDCEGGGETFSVVSQHSPPHSRGLLSEDDPSKKQPEMFFDKPAFLTVSSQLHLEALAAANSRVYTLSPCFRAERSQTNRHLAEFHMLEAEWAFTKSIEDVCVTVEDAIKAAASAASAAEDLDVNVLQLQKPWPRISYTDAIRELESHHSSPSSTFKFSPTWGSSLQSEHEKWLATSLGSPVFVTDYSSSLKPFYMRLNDDEKTVACFDLLIPGLGELVGGSLREERLPYLDAALDKHGLDKAEYSWYADLRRFGGTPHGGFGLGFERLVSCITGVENVRECIPMPRWAGRMLL